MTIVKVIVTEQCVADDVEPVVITRNLPNSSHREPSFEKKDTNMSEMPKTYDAASVEERMLRWKWLDGKSITRARRGRAIARSSFRRLT